MKALKSLYGEDKSVSYLEEELAADQMFDVFDESTVNELVKENRTLAEKIRDFLTDFVDYIKERARAFSGESDSFNEKDLKKIRDMFFKALDEAKNNTVSDNADGGVMKSINIAFADDVNEWYKYGHKNGETFILGNTSDVLQGLGARENDIYMNSDKINTILKEHPEMTINEISKIPEILENPVLVLKSKNNVKVNSRIVMFGNITAENGKPVLCILDFMPEENHIIIDDMQKAVSAYTKTNSIESTKKFFEHSDVLYTTKNKKVATNLLTRVGFYMPTDLLISGYIGSITYENEDVNIKGKPFNDVFKFDDTSNSSISEKSEKDTEYITSGKKAVMTKDRIDYLIADSGAGSRTDYAQAWIISINPTDFINLTTDKLQDRAAFDKSKSDYGNTMENYDYVEALKSEKRRTPYNYC